MLLNMCRIDKSNHVREAAKAALKILKEIKLPTTFEINETY